MSATEDTVGNPYRSGITLIETGEDLRLDTWLRIKFITERAYDLIPEDKRTLFINTISGDTECIYKRLGRPEADDRTAEEIGSDWRQDDR